MELKLWNQCTKLIIDHYFFLHRMSNSKGQLLLFKEQGKTQIDLGILFEKLGQTNREIRQWQ